MKRTSTVNFPPQANTNALRNNFSSAVKNARDLAPELGGTAVVFVTTSNPPTFEVFALSALASGYPKGVKLITRFANAHSPKISTEAA